MNEELITVKKYFRDEQGNNTDRLKYEYTTLNGKKHGEDKEYHEDGSLAYIHLYREGSLHGLARIHTWTGDIEPATIYYKNGSVDLSKIYEPIWEAIEKLEASNTVATHLVLEIALSPNRDTISVNVVEEVK